MKKIQSSILFLFATTFVFAQGFQGQATYSYKKALYETATDTSSKTSKSAAEELDDRQMREDLKKAFEKTFVLDFNTFESSFLREFALATPVIRPNGSSISVTTAGEDTPLYKNTKTKQFLQERENYKGQTVLITDNLPIYDWKIEGETKKIGGYDCYKATTIIKVTPKQMADYEALKMKQSKKKTVLFPAKEPKDLLVEAWFTNDIPVSHGPAKYWGLPGLILELNEGRTTYLCSKIVLNPKDKKAIAVPKKGKVTSLDDFAAAEKAYFDKMSDGDGVIMHETTTEDKK